MKKKEKNTEQKREELFEKFKSVELSPLPYFTNELLYFPEEMAKEMRQIADRHNCTVSYVISHFLTDFLSETKEITEISAESLIELSKNKPYLLIKKDGKPFARVSFFGEDERWLKDYEFKENESK